MKVKIGARYLRAVAYGVLTGALYFLLFYMAIVPIMTLDSTFPMSPSVAGVLGFVLAFAAALGIELSKDIEAKEAEKTSA